MTAHVVSPSELETDLSDDLSNEELVEVYMDIHDWVLVLVGALDILGGTDEVDSKVGRSMLGYSSWLVLWIVFDLETVDPPGDLFPAAHCLQPP